MDSTIDALRLALADRYRIERELGAGGMATVYLARDLRHDRDVAIKVMHPEIAQSLGAERFLREIAMTANLRHPHILPLYDSGNANGVLFYVMPFIDGGSLRDRLKRDRQLPIDEALTIAREVADALGYAHACGVVHRDIKPENILLERGHAVVSDFGIARAVTALGSERITETGIGLGNAREKNTSGAPLFVRHVIPDLFRRKRQNGRHQMDQGVENPIERRLRRPAGVRSCSFAIQPVFDDVEILRA